jgi:hypothetical protein
MAFRFRSALKVIPGIRLNLSKSGASVSLGGRGFHYTIGPKGTRTTVGLPGTGLSWTNYRSYTGSNLGNEQSNPVRYLPSSEPNAGATQSEPTLSPIESKRTDEINALSTSQLAPILNSAYHRFRLAPLLLAVSLCSFILALNSGLQELVGLSALCATIFVPLSVFLDRYRRSVKVSLTLNTAGKTIATVLNDAFSDLRSAERIWSIRAEGRTADWKRNAGATTLNHRDPIYPGAARPVCVRGRIAFPTLKVGGAEIFFLPDAVLVISNKAVAALNYADLDFSSTSVRFIEEDKVPSDTTIVGQTWRFVNKAGGPDRRFNFNKQLPICEYGEMEFRSAGGLHGMMQISKLAAGKRFTKALQILIRYASSGSDIRPIASYQEAKRWPSLVLLSCALSISGCLMALSALAILAKVQLSAAAIQPDSKFSAPPRPDLAVQTGKNSKNNNSQLMRPLVIVPPQLR